MKRRRKKKAPVKKIKTTDLVLIVLGVATFLFTVKMIALFESCGAIPDTLVERYFTTVVGECGIMGVITAVKVRHPDGTNDKTGVLPDEDLSGGDDGQG